MTAAIFVLTFLMVLMMSQNRLPLPPITLPMTIIWLVVLSLHFSLLANGAQNCSKDKSSCKPLKSCWDKKLYLALGVVASAYLSKYVKSTLEGGLSAVHWSLYQSAKILRGGKIGPIEEFKLKSAAKLPPTSEAPNVYEDDSLLPVVAIVLLVLLCALLLIWYCYCRRESAEGRQRWTTFKKAAGQLFKRCCPCCLTAAQEEGNTALMKQIADYPGEASLMMESTGESSAASQQPFDNWPKREKFKKKKKKTTPPVFESSITTDEEASSSEVPKKHMKKSRSRKT